MDGSGRGIIGPGVEVDPNAPTDDETNFTAGDCDVKVLKDATGAIISVTSADCDVTVKSASSITIDGRKIIFVSRRHNHRSCL